MATQVRLSKLGNKVAQAQEKYTKQAGTGALGKSRKIGVVEKMARKADQAIGDAVAVGKVAASEAENTSRDITERVSKEARRLQEQGQKTVGIGGLPLPRGRRTRQSRI